MLRSSARVRFHAIDAEGRRRGRLQVNEPSRARPAEWNWSTHDEDNRATVLPGTGPCVESEAWKHSSGEGRSLTRGVSVRVTGLAAGRRKAHFLQAGGRRPSRDAMQRIRQDS